MSGAERLNCTMKTLDMDSLQLAKGSHEPNDAQMCVMEAVAYIAGEPWSDSPQCASPVIAAFLRSYNDSVSNEKRQELKQYIPRLIGTRGSEALEERRSLIAADWMVRVYTPALLRLAGLIAQADALAGLPEITALAQVPSIKPAIEAARKDAAAAGAWAAARAAAWYALNPTVDALQATVPALIERLLAAKEDEPVEDQKRLTAQFSLVRDLMTALVIAERRALVSERALVISCQRIDYFLLAAERQLIAEGKVQP
jgi:hypothetical protein